MSTEVKRFGKFELREQLGQDALAETWKAYDSQSQRYVVFKLLHTHLQNDPYFLSRFEREAKELKELHHPHLLQIQDTQISYPPQSKATVAYLILDYIEGQTLAAYIHNTSFRKRFPTATDIISLFTAVGGAVDYAHQNGIKYCNVNPGNILLDKQMTVQNIGKPVLINYEIPTLLGNPTKMEAYPASGYFSPEQAKGSPGNERSDIYQLGIMLYEICTGTLPFQDEASQDASRRSIHTLIPPQNINPLVSPALSRVIIHCLAEEPGARFPNASALVSALKDAFNVSGIQEVVPPSTPPSPPRIAAPAQAPSDKDKKKRNPLLIALLTLLMLLLLSSGLYALFTMLYKPAAPAGTGSIVGHAYLRSSGQITDANSNGLNDELQLTLTNIPDAAPNKSYYLWLLSDLATKPTTSIALGSIPISQGRVNRIFTTPEHKNLIATTSRLLITEEASGPTPKQFSTDRRAWRYYAEIPQRTLSPGAPRLGSIRYLRFLLFESNKMIAQGIHGGSATLLLRNTQKVLEWAGSARDDWALQRYDLIHRHFIRILDYIDGSAFVSVDLPPETPLLVNPTLAQNGLVTIVPGENPESYPPRAAFSILSFIEAAPNLSPEKQELGIKTEKDVRVNIEQHLQLVRQYAKQLFAMNNEQLAQKSTLSILDHMLEQARIAYSGEYDPSVNHFVGGALNDYHNIQYLASYDIAPYTPGAELPS
jgi:serine/threonine protein kinase